jgi:hypothetical protein
VVAGFIDEVANEIVEGDTCMIIVILRIFPVLGSCYGSAEPCTTEGSVVLVTD